MQLFGRIVCILICILSASSYAMAPRINWDKAIDNAIKRYGLSAELDLIQDFNEAGVSYPPQKVSLLAFKQEAKIELWALQDGHWKFIRNYPLTAQSGELGPKLRENDQQIPEGLYKLVSFNPFSTMHLSILVDYPNGFDKKIAKQERRKKLGNNIFIHGKDKSVGCLAVGDRAIDQIFVMLRRVGLENTRLIIAPNDLRKSKAHTNLSKYNPWVKTLYKNIRIALSEYKA